MRINHNSKKKFVIFKAMNNNEIINNNTFQNKLYKDIIFRLYR